MNAKELDLFHRITAAVQCPEERVRAIQWAADEELQEWSMPSLKQVLLIWLAKPSPLGISSYKELFHRDHVLLS